MRGRVSALVWVLATALLLAACAPGNLAGGAAIDVATASIGKFAVEVTKETGVGEENEKQAAPPEEAVISADEATAEPPTDEGSSEEATPLPLGDDKTPQSVKECFAAFPSYPLLKNDPKMTDHVSSLFVPSFGAGATEARAYLSDDPLKKVLDFYKAEPAQRGWEHAPIQAIGEEGGTLAWRKGQLMIMLMIARDRNKNKSSVALVCGMTK